MADSGSELTPEKRLLQLIEGGKAESSSATAPSPPPPKSGFIEKLSKLFSPEGLKAFIFSVKESFQSFTQGRKDFLNLKGVNRALRVFTVGLAVYLGLSLIHELRLSNRSITETLQMHQMDVPDIEFSETNIFDTNLLREEKKMVVFVPHARREQEKEEEKESEMSLRLAGMIANWKLAGISIHPENPSRTFCMIEDLQRNTTSFLRVGDTISGLKIEEIKPDSVVLRFNQETIELR